jgi:hypothetical protein
MTAGYGWHRVLGQVGVSPRRVSKELQMPRTTHNLGLFGWQTMTTSSAYRVIDVDFSRRARRQRIPNSIAFCQQHVKRNDD